MSTCILVEERFHARFRSRLIDMLHWRIWPAGRRRYKFRIRTFPLFRAKVNTNGLEARATTGSTC